MLKHPTLAYTVLILALCFSTTPFAKTEITMHEVYLAAEAGQFAQAQALMDQVLAEHPNSAKAHFVEAELLAKQGDYNKARTELGIAERLQPGLPFVKPEALKTLKAKISPSASNWKLPDIKNLPSIFNNQFPTYLKYIAFGFVVLLIMWLKRRNAPANFKMGYSGSVYSSTPPYGAGQATSNGAGSGLMGSLATGAALGAGVVAGEALMHKLLDGDDPRAGHSFQDMGVDSSTQADDLGGTDFGITDTSSWDNDTSGGGGDDWT